MNLLIFSPFTHVTRNLSEKSYEFREWKRNRNFDGCCFLKKGGVGAKVQGLFFSSHASVDAPVILLLNSLLYLMLIFPRRVVFWTYNLYLKMLIFDRDINLNTVVKPAMHTSFAEKAKEDAIGCKYCFRQRIRSCTLENS